jgi:hypothetical protein
VGRGRLELVGIVAAHLALSLTLVDWSFLADGPVGSLVYQVAFRLVLPVVAAVGLWAGRRWAWWALLGLFVVRAIGELSAFAYYGRDSELGWRAWPVQKAGLLAGGYAALSLWVGLSGGLRRLSRVSGR